MSRTIKRMTAVLLSVILMTTIFTALPFTANAATSGTTGDCTWTLDDNGTLTISGEGEMEGYNDLAGRNAPWVKTVKKAIIQSGVSNISKEAFLESNNLVSVTISDTVKTLGVCSFRLCQNLKYITIPKSVTKIQYQAFEYCINLEAVVIPDNVSDIGNDAFYACKKLTIYCKKYSTAYFYAQNNNIPTAPIEDAPKFDVPQSGTTGDCTWTLDDNGTLTISGNGNMDDYGDQSFYPYSPWDETAVKKVVIENGVKDIGREAFKDCKNLTEVTISNSVTEIGRKAFSGCEKLQAVTIPTGVEAIGWGAFDSCKSLKSIMIPDNVTNLGDHAFCNCSGLESVTIGNSITQIGELTFHACKNLSNVSIGNSVKSIGYCAFDLCDKLKSITVPDSVTHIEYQALGYYEYDYSFIKIPGFIIYGKTGTAAEQYANQYGFTFIPASDEPTEPTTVEPTTAEPTTEPIVVEPTTVEPTTEPIIKVIIGDVNGDGNVNGADAGLLNRYTSGWKGYADKIKNMSAADINGDGNVNGADAGILARHTSGWKQYDRYFN